MPRQRLEAAETAHRSAVAQRDLAQGEPGAGRGRASARSRSPARRDAHRAGRRLRRRAQLRRRRHSRRSADRRRRRLRQLKLEAGVSELEAGRLKTGLPALVSVQAKPGETFTGQLAAIAPEVDERNRHFRIEVRVDNRDARAARRACMPRHGSSLASADKALTRAARSRHDARRQARRAQGRRRQGDAGRRHRRPERRTAGADRRPASPPAIRSSPTPGASCRPTRASRPSFSSAVFSPRSRLSR